MRRWWMIPMALFLAVACRPKDKFAFSEEMLGSVPDTVINFETMVNITTDIHLAESWAQERGPDTIPKDMLLKQYYGEIFTIWQVTDAEYRRSYSWYVNQPILMQELYNRVTNKLNILESEQGTIKKPIKNE